MPPKTQAAPPKTDASGIPDANLKKTYLLSYNAISAALWLGVLGRVAMWGYHSGVESGKVYENSEEYTRLVQSLAGLEVVHSLVGMLCLVHFPSSLGILECAGREERGDREKDKREKDEGIWGT